MRSTEPPLRRAGALVVSGRPPRGAGSPSRTTFRHHGGHISTELRINDRIRVPEVRLVGPNGETVGIVPTDEALKLAQEADLDLVEIAPMARPPVCKLMDYGKFKYENAQKAREARRNQTNVIIKEMKLRPKIDEHDYETKKGHVVRFLKAGDKVKITIMFRGREQHRPELGFRLLQRLAEDVTELGFVESAPKQDGRNMIMVLGPHKKKAEAKVEVKAAKADRGRRSAPTARPRSTPSATAAHAAGPRRPEEGARSLREPRPRDRGLSEAKARSSSARAVQRRPRASRSQRRTNHAREERADACRRTRRTPARASASR